MKTKFLLVLGLVLFTLMGSGIHASDFTVTDISKTNHLNSERDLTMTPVSATAQPLDVFNNSSLPFEAENAAEGMIDPVGAYITVWKTDNPGDSNPNQILILAKGEFNYAWENLAIPSLTGSGYGNNKTTITFPTPGSYRLIMKPTGLNPFHRIFFDYNESTEQYYDGEKLLKVEQWGDIVWTSFEQAYLGCSNLEFTATDIPDLSKVTNMSRAFSRLGITDIPKFHRWDMRSVERMDLMFAGSKYFNQPIGSWRVHRVNNMHGMFWGATSFNQPIGQWDVSNVTKMTYMFYAASNFNQPIGSWDVSNVTIMSSMFERATNFNQPIGQWDVSNVEGMSSMFAKASNFNQNIGNWNVSNVKTMWNMFMEASNFDQNLGEWNLASVMEYDSKLNGIGLSKSGMGCENYSLSLNGWAYNPNTPKDLVLEARTMKFSPHAIASIDELTDILNWTINGASEGACQLTSYICDYTANITVEEDCVELGGNYNAKAMVTGGLAGDTFSFILDDKIVKDDIRADEMITIPSEWLVGGEDYYVVIFSNTEPSCSFVLNIESPKECRTPTSGNPANNAENRVSDFASNFDNFTFHPNPVVAELSLKAGVDIEQVEVFNILGQEVIKIRPNDTSALLDMSGMESGVYLMNVTIDDVQKTFRVIKK